MPRDENRSADSSLEAASPMAFDRIIEKSEEVEPELSTTLKGESALPAAPNADSRVDESARAQTDDQKVRTWIRIGVFCWGSVFLALGVADGIRDAFDASALYFGATGASLVIGAITGRPQKLKDAE